MGFVSLSGGGRAERQGGTEKSRLGNTLGCSGDKIFVGDKILDNPDVSGDKIFVGDKILEK